MKNALLIIDAQNDFVLPTGSLKVDGAMEDMERLAKFIENNIEEIDYIGLTQDSHQVLDISHPGFWQDKDGNLVPPFTQITHQDVLDGKWTPRLYPAEATKYLKDLEAEGEFPHVIWTEHCLIGTEGAAIVNVIMNAVKKWSRERNKFYFVHTKGTYPITEHFGAFRANVPMMNRPETQVNTALIKTLESYDNVYFAGEAESHCINYTLKQAFDYPTLAKRFVILEDCMSPVTGFEDLSKPTFDTARNMGIKFEKAENLKL